MEKIQFKDLPDTTTPLSASNLNTMQDNIEEAIDITNTYSTDEMVVGKWINNKPLYRKVISTGSLPNATTKVITQIDSTWVIRKFDGCVSSNLPFTLSIQNASVSSINENIQWYVDQNYNLIIKTGSDRSGYEGYAIIEYTKTTD